MLLTTKVVNCPSVHWNTKMYTHHKITILTEWLIQVIKIVLRTDPSNWLSTITWSLPASSTPAPHSARSSLQWMNTCPPTLVIWCVMMVAQYLFFPCACFGFVCLCWLPACLPHVADHLPWIKWSSFYPYVLDFAFEVTHCLPEALQYKNRREETWTSCYCVTE